MENEWNKLSNRMKLKLRKWSRKLKCKTNDFMTNSICYYGWYKLQLTLVNCFVDIQWRFLREKKEFDFKAFSILRWKLTCENFFRQISHWNGRSPVWVWEKIWQEMECFFTVELGFKGEIKNLPSCECRGKVSDWRPMDIENIDKDDPEWCLLENEKKKEGNELKKLWKKFQDS